MNIDRKHGHLNVQLLNSDFKHYYLYSLFLILIGRPFQGNLFYLKFQDTIYHIEGILANSVICNKFAKVLPANCL